MLNKITQGDCLIESENIPSGSVDLILTDLPYGTMNGFNGIDWDFAIDPKDVYTIANRILRKNGKMILFSQEPYTSRMITEAISNVPFSYRAVWEKDNFANALLCNKAMVGYYEDILIFSKNSEAVAPEDYEGKHPLRPYFKRIFEYINLPKKSIIEKIGHRADHSFRTDSTQFRLGLEQTYSDLIHVFNIDRMDNFIDFSELKLVDTEFKKSRDKKRQEYLKEHNEKYPSVFNLWEGGKYKSNILRYKKDYNGYHPTQKPVLLLEDLIKNV